MPGIGTLEVTMINAGIPTIFVNAEAIGYTGTELQDAINGDTRALAMFETIRAHGAVRMGLIKHVDEAAKRQHTPKVAFVAQPADYVSSSGKRVAAADVDVLVRALSMGKLHHAMMGTAAVAIGTAAAIPARSSISRLAAATATPCASAILRARCASAPRRAGQWRVDRDQGDHEPQRARADGRLGARARRCVLTNDAAGTIRGCTRAVELLMSELDMKSAKRPDPDTVLVDIASYAAEYQVQSDTAYETAFYCLMDSLACGFQALKYPACTKLLGPVVPGATMADGARVPGTSYELDPVQAAFNIGAMVRWLDFNDTWLAAEWGHPSDNLGGILAVADYLSRKSGHEGRPAADHARRADRR